MTSSQNCSCHCHKNAIHIPGTGCKFYGCYELVCEHCTPQQDTEEKILGVDEAGPVPDRIWSTTNRETTDDWGSEFDDEFKPAYWADRLKVKDWIRVKKAEWEKQQLQEAIDVVRGMLLTFAEPSKSGNREMDGWYNHALEDAARALEELLSST